MHVRQFLGLSVSLVLFYARIINSILFLLTTTLFSLLDGLIITGAHGACAPMLDLLGASKSAF